MKKSITTGLIVYAVLTYLILIGIPIRLEAAAFPALSVVAALLYYGLFRKSLSEASTGRATSSGLIAGLTTGLFTSAMIWIFATLIGSGTRVQPVFDKIVPQNLAALLSVSPGAIATGEVPPTAYLMQVAMLAVAGIVGGLLVLLFRSDGMDQARAIKIPGGRWIIIVLPFVLMAIIVLLGQDWVSFGGRNQGTIRLLITMIAVGAGLYSQRAARPGREKLVVNILLLLCIAALPFTLDQFQNSVMGLVFIFAMMGLGLNIVVGFAGLLDLGYVAFFAIGAYVYAFISAPSSSQAITNMLVSIGISPASPVMSFWMAIPFTMAAAGLGGVLLGIPVLRMRGDYLAIVTLGFGEIIRLFMLNLDPLTNGPRGMLNIVPPVLFGYEMSRPRDIFILALIGSAVIAFVSFRLSDSRLGRSWDAMREDEDVAQATGIHLVRTKLLAFSIGATFAGLAGQIFAARQVNIFPENFTLFVSIDALAMIIVGGIGSIPGVILGAVALKGLPEVLRGVDEYRIVTFAALLIIMMIVRPEGLLPSARRQHELHADDEPGGLDEFGHADEYIEREQI